MRWRIATLDVLAWLIAVPLLTAVLLGPILGFAGWPDALVPGDREGDLTLAEPPPVARVERVSAPAPRTPRRESPRRPAEPRRAATPPPRAAPPLPVELPPVQLPEVELPPVELPPLELPELPLPLPR